MKNIHIVFSDWTLPQIKTLKQYDIHVEKGYSSFQIEENEAYQQIQPYLKEWKVSETIISKFSEEDLKLAKRLVLLSPWANGYPMPDNNFGYLNTTYNNQKYCSECGIGLIQKEPFRLKKAPNWGNKNMFTLNWVFDEIFVRKDFYEAVLKKYSVDVLPVLLHKKETIIDDTVQLNIQTTDSPLELKGHDFQNCQKCGSQRYDLINKGFFPSFKSDINAGEIFKTNEYFGTGANARKYIMISQKLRQELVKHKIKTNYIPQL